MPFRPYQIESDYRMDESQYGACPSGYSIIEHPFRILVHDSDGRLLIVATATFGPADDPDKFSMELINSIKGWHDAMIINRCYSDIHRVVIREGAI